MNACTKVFRGSLALLTWIACDVAQAQVATMPVAADFNEGDRWEWRRTDELTHARTAGLVRTVTASDGTIVFHVGAIDASLERIYVEGVGRGHASGKPWRTWPMQVGNRWSFDSEWEGQIGPVRSTQRAEVVAFEEVTVPAGRYMAFRIEYRGQWIARGTVSHKIFEGPQEDVYWYAPSIRCDVKHTRNLAGTHITDELIGYLPGPVAR